MPSNTRPVPKGRSFKDEYGPNKLHKVWPQFSDSYIIYNLSTKGGFLALRMNKSTSSKASSLMRLTGPS